MVDSKIGLDVDVSVRCSGVYSYKIADPLLFYTNVCGNVEQEYTREELDGQLKTEFISALQPAFGRLSDLELRPNQIVSHNTDLENAMNTALSEKWGALRGLKVVSIALGSVTLPEEDAEMIKQAQRTAIMRDPTMAAATLVGAQADAMKAAASNEAGAMTGFMGMGMAMNAGGGMNTQNLFANNGNALAAIQPPASSVKTAVRKSPNLRLRQVHGNAGAVPRLPVSSVLSAVLPSRRTRMAGPVPAARSTKESSVRTAVRKSRKERRYTAVTSAAGSRRIRRIRRSSAPNAATSLMTATGNNILIMKIIRMKTTADRFAAPI